MGILLVNPSPWLTNRHVRAFLGEFRRSIVVSLLKTKETRDSCTLSLTESEEYNQPYRQKSCRRDKLIQERKMTG
jgi:hypothetical protein